MKYANTALISGVETVVTVLPLVDVPLFRPEAPPQANTYGVSDAVEVGWIKSGAEFVPPEILAENPSSVSRAQGFEAMAHFGLLEAYTAWYFATTPDNRRRMDNISEFRYGSPLLSTVSAELGITDAQLRELFAFAKTVEI